MMRVLGQCVVGCAVMVCVAVYICVWVLVVGVNLVWRAVDQEAPK